MTVIVSPNVVLTDGTEVNANSPIIGYQQLATVSNIESWTADADYPITNVVNPSTYEKWIGVIGSPTLDEEYITITLDTNEDVDYIAFAGHNFGSGLFPVSVEGQATDTGSPEDWIELNEPVLLGSTNEPTIFRFEAQSLYQIRIRLQASQLATPIAPQAAVIYVGKLLIMQRRIYVGHTPITYGRDTRVLIGRSENANFLGRVILSESKQTSIEMKHITPDWYRTYMDPFVIAAKERPFFFNWRPGDYPYETGYCWTTGDIIPTNILPNGMMSFEFDVRGIA